MVSLCMLRFPLHDLIKLICRHRFCKIKPLYHIAALLGQKFYLLFFLNTFGYNLHIQSLRQTNRFLDDNLSALQRILPAEKIHIQL